MVEPTRSATPGAGAGKWASYYGLLFVVASLYLPQMSAASVSLLPNGLNATPAVALLKPREEATCSCPAFRANCSMSSCEEMGGKNEDLDIHVPVKSNFLSPGKEKECCNYFFDDVDMDCKATYFNESAIVPYCYFEMDGDVTQTLCVMGLKCNANNNDCGDTKRFVCEEGSESNVCREKDNTNIYIYGSIAAVILTFIASNRLGLQR